MAARGGVARRASTRSLQALYFLKSVNPDRGLGVSEMSPSGAELLRQVKSQIERSTRRGQELIDEGVTIVDVRGSEEFATGHLPGAKSIPRGHLESRIEGVVPDRSARR